MSIFLLILAIICIVCFFSTLFRKNIPDNYHSYGKSIFSSFIRTLRMALGIDNITEEACSEISDSIWLKDVLPERYILCEGDVTELIRTEDTNIILGRKYYVTVKIRYNGNDMEIMLSDPVYWKRTDRELNASDFTDRMYRYDTRTNTCKMMDNDNSGDTFRLGILSMTCILSYILFAILGK